jgi:lysophospholipase L1-like esterase
MTELTDRPAPGSRTPRPSALVEPDATTRTMPAGKVLAVMLIAFGLSGLFNSKRFVHAAETMPFGWQRTWLLHVAHPVDWLAVRLHTDVPRERVDQALGRTGNPANGGAFEPPAGVLPTAIPSAGPTASAAPGPSVPAFRDASAASPLKLFVTGDSMIEFMAPKLIARGEESHALHGSDEVKYGTGLVRDDVLNWPAYAHQQMVRYDPEAVVVMMGGNDGQGMTLPGGKILREGSPEWAAEYKRRATIMMEVFTEGGKRHLYWVGMPIAKSARLTGLYRQIDDALRAAATAVPGVTYVDIWNDFAPGGHYADFVDGQLVRARDGIHLNRDGSARLMRKLYAILDADWKLTS